MTTPDRLAAAVAQGHEDAVQVCTNCDGRECMACVFREVHDACVDTCPDCCQDAVQVGPQEGATVTAQERAGTAGVECPLSQRVDGQQHTWLFDGDDPYVKCCWCGQMQDALTGRVIREGQR